MIAGARVALSASSLVAVWFDPSEPARFASLTYTLHWVYVSWSIVLACVAWLGTAKSTLTFFSHAADIVLFSVFQYLTLGPSSPFFVYFVFAMFCGALRWGWKGALATTVVVMCSYAAMTISMSRTLDPGEFELNRIIIRGVYLLMAAGMLVYLGRYEERLRGEIDRLAHWPAPGGKPADRATAEILEHAARIMGAGRAVIVWDTEDEPSVQLAAWSGEGLSTAQHPPSDLLPLLPPSLEDKTFLVAADVDERSRVLVKDASGALVEHSGLPLHPTLLTMTRGVGLASAPFRTDRISGRVLFIEMGTPTSEVVPLTELVAREIGVSLDQIHLTHQMQEIASREERIRLARDLHDGVLQSLTGIRLEIRALSGAITDEDDSVRARLIALEHALGIEQRELRYFIGGLRPGTSAGGSLATRLDALRERLALEWKTPVSIRVSPEFQECPRELAQAVPLMVHEAVVNALKHAQPTRVNVNVDGALDRLRIVVSDDGRGFPFKGRYDHRALGESTTAPRSLFDRVSSLGGKMSIESSDTGSRVEMVVSL